VRERTAQPVWVYGSRPVLARLVETTSNDGVGDDEAIALVTDDPKRLEAADLDDPRLTALVSSTPSPFSHDANLIRTLVADLGITGICGLDLASCGARAGDTIEIAEDGTVVVAGHCLLISKGVAGSDESLATTLETEAVCYRPTYLYDEWMGRLIADGLDAGIAVLVGGNAATRDDAGRVWLVGGPKPSQIADWILGNRQRHLEMLLELTTALDGLATSRWPQQGILTDPQFLSLLRANCRIAPFVGFALFSLTAKVAELAEMAKLDGAVTELARLISRDDRQRARFSEQSATAVEGYLRQAILQGEDVSAPELVAATILLSDTRRLTIDDLRRRYPAFGQQVRHRDAYAAA
jgi:hypothetical protein